MFLQYYNNLPKALTDEDNKKLFDQYNQSHSPEIKERIFYGNMRLVRGATKKYAPPYQKYDSYDDYFQTFLLYLFNKWIDDYAAKLASGETYAFSTHVYQNVYAKLKTIKLKAEHHMDAHAESREKLAAERNDRDDADFKDEFIVERPETARGREQKIELDYIRDKYFKYLTPFEQLTIEKFYLEGCTLKEIAKLNNVSPQFVTFIFANAEKVLKKCCQHGEPKFIKTRRLRTIPFCDELLDNYGKFLDGMELSIVLKYYVENLTLAQISQNYDCKQYDIAKILINATEKLFTLYRHANLQQ